MKNQKQKNEINSFSAQKIILKFVLEIYTVSLLDKCEN